MENNYYSFERRTNNEVASLRAQGVRSQELARAGLVYQKKLRFPDLRRVIRQILFFLPGNRLHRIEQPAVGKSAAD